MLYYGFPLKACKYTKYIYTRTIHIHAIPDKKTKPYMYGIQMLYKIKKDKKKNKKKNKR